MLSLPEHNSHDFPLARRSMVLTLVPSTTGPYQLQLPRVEQTTDEPSGFEAPEMIYSYKHTLGSLLPYRVTVGNCHTWPTVCRKGTASHQSRQSIRSFHPHMDELQTRM